MAHRDFEGVHYRFQNQCKPGKERIGDFDSEIQLDNNIFQLCTPIRGRFFLTTGSGIKCRGIRVQLDATVNLKFETKVDNRVNSHKKMESLFQGTSEASNRNGYYIPSPVRDQVVENDDDEDPVILEPGKYTYPFTLTMPAEPLPSPFKSNCGHLQYKIVAYMKSQYCYIQVSEKALRFRGYNNLSEQPNAFEAIQQESGFQKSMFSSKKAITAVISLEKVGFLPGEDVVFNLKITNPKSFAVRTVTVNLNRRVTYNVNGSTKSTLGNLDTFEINEISKDEEITFVGKLTVPKQCMPTYNVKPMYSVVHLLQYQVKVAEYPGPMKGQVEIIIGTTKEPVSSLMTRRMSYLQVDDHGRLERSNSSNSISSRLSDSSVMSTISLPPAYSQLSSRAVSMLSLETLPPHYEDLS